MDTRPGPWLDKKQAEEQEVSSRWASRASSGFTATCHHSRHCLSATSSQISGGIINSVGLNHPKTFPAPTSVEKLSWLKLVPGAKKIGDRCLRLPHCSPGLIEPKLNCCIVAFSPKCKWRTCNSAWSTLFAMAYEDCPDLALAIATTSSLLITLHYWMSPVLNFARLSTLCVFFHVQTFQVCSLRRIMNSL